MILLNMTKIKILRLFSKYKENIIYFINKINNNGRYFYIKLFYGLNMLKLFMKYISNSLIYIKISFNLIIITYLYIIMYNVYCKLYFKKIIITNKGYILNMQINKQYCFYTKILDVRKIVKVRKGCSLRRFSLIILVGDINRYFSYGIGKDIIIGKALIKAKYKAFKTLKRYDNFYNYINNVFKYKYITILIKRFYMGQGINLIEPLYSILYLLGVVDLGGSIIKCGSMLNLLKTINLVSNYLQHYRNYKRLNFTLLCRKYTIKELTLL